MCNPQPASSNDFTMPMPTYVNERLVKTGCWTEREDDLLAEWQSKYGNRWLRFSATSAISLYSCFRRTLQHTAFCNVSCKGKTMTLADMVIFMNAGGAWLRRRSQAGQDSSVHSGGVIRCKQLTFTPLCCCVAVAQMCLVGLRTMHMLLCHLVSPVSLTAALSQAVQPLHKHCSAV